MAETHRAHGTYTKYVHDACRCEECRRANREKEARRTLRKKNGDFWWEWTHAGPVREHLLGLMKGNRPHHRQGLGPKSMAKMTGVPHGVISALIYGRYDRVPKKVDGTPDRRYQPKKSTKIKRAHAEKLLALTEKDLAGGAMVDAYDTRKYLDCLIAFGLPKGRIAESIRRKHLRPMPEHQALQVARFQHVAVFTAKAVWSLHWRVWLTSPHFRDRCGCHVPAKVHALREARARGVSTTRLRSWTADWVYKTEEAAVYAAGRFCPSDLKPIVTLRQDGTYRWYIHPAHVPAGERAVRWREAPHVWRPHKPHGTRGKRWEEAPRP